MQAISLFLLLLGPSGAGKSTIINHLRELDNRFEYISPNITRPLRIGETDKISISQEEFDRLNQNGDFLAVNVLYGISYGTPKSTIENAFSAQKFPILDWPLKKLETMQAAFPKKLFCVYIAPPDSQTLKARLEKDNRDPQGLRYAAAIEELNALKNGEYCLNTFDLYIVNSDGNSYDNALKIYDAYTKKCNK